MCERKALIILNAKRKDKKLVKSLCKYKNMVDIQFCWRRINLQRTTVRVKIHNSIQTVQKCLEDDVYSDRYYVKPKELLSQYITIAYYNKKQNAYFQ